MTASASLSATRFGAALGAVVEGVDFRVPVSPDTAAELRVLLDEHQVLFFHDRHLDAEQQVAVARLFGVPGGAEPYRTLDGDACNPVSVQSRATTSALNSGVNERHGRGFFRSIVPMMDILSGAAPLIADVRQTGAGPTQPVM